MAEQKCKLKQGKDVSKPKKVPRAGRGSGRRDAYTRYEMEGRRAKNKARNLKRAQKQQDDARIRRAKRQLQGKNLRTARAIRRYGL